MPRLDGATQNAQRPLRLFSNLANLLVSWVVKSACILLRRAGVTRASMAMPAPFCTKSILWWPA